MGWWEKNRNPSTEGTTKDDGIEDTVCGTSYGTNCCGVKDRAHACGKPTGHGGAHGDCAFGD